MASRAKTYEVLAEVQSRRTGSVYEIRRGSDERVYCTCFSWRYSRESPKTCHHLREYLTQAVIGAKSLQQRLVEAAARISQADIAALLREAASALAEGGSTVTPSPSVDTPKDRGVRRIILED